MKRITLLLLLVGSFSLMNAQSNEKFKDKITDAEYLFLNEDYADALNVYKEVYKQDPENANICYRIGLCYQMLPFEAGRSIPYLETAIKSLSKSYKEGSYKERNAPIDALYYLAYAYHTNNYIEKAIETYTTYRDSLPISDVYNIKLTERQIESALNAKEIMKNPVEIEISNIGNVVNSALSDYNPAVTADGKTIIFTRGIPAKISDTAKISVDLQEKRILISRLHGDENWSKPVDITDSLGTKGKCETLSLSADGNTLLLYKNDWEEGGITDFKAGTIYYSEKKNGAWQSIKKFDNTINTFEFESHACISPDGKRIYFASERKGGFGGLDIYVSTKNDAGTWSEAVNLGPTINTPFDEDTPYLLEDGKTLYFSSEGHYNMGGFDIFTSVFNNGSWSTPVNIGYPINTSADNVFYVPVKNGAQAFYSLARHEGYLTFGGMDIYKMDIVPEKEKRNDIVKEFTVKGTVRLEDFGELDSSFSVTVFDSVSKQIVASVKPDIKTGEYSLIVKDGTYSISFKGDNYREDKKIVNMESLKLLNTPVLIVNANLVPESIDAKKYFIIRNIFFDYNSSALNRDALIEVEKLLSIMLENPGLYIEVIGHTDSQGSVAYNKKLSADRARTVVDYLVAKGVEPTRFVARGVGKGQLIAIDYKADGTTVQEGAQLNRRVEIRILKTGNQATIVTLDEQVPDAIRFKDYNRFSVCLEESATIIEDKKFANVKDVAPVVNHIETKQGYLYYFGDFDSKGDASLALNKVIAKGYKNAYLINYFELNKKNKFIVTNQNEVMITYTIQLKAVERQLVLDAFTKLDGIKQYKTSDGFYRYTYKEFTDIELAKEELKNVIARGFTDAFIIEVDKLKK